ncbi:MAG: hypothetical protein QG646_1461, partial [Euryarchaeota archaeon]|nr:hypothetical protein [Euryarchaeota archaeon]
MVIGGSMTKMNWKDRNVFVTVCIHTLPETVVLINYQFLIFR